ncbi:ABC transporter, permease protein, DrrB family [Lacticaseibacillus thailandensis DSM 22698 = JCM 13996]|uniref:ABC transporter, permease protein, DrrB family n=2 Tax=Lacticaseibacillus thailandensis TaxID=381741 RepID=A0A0R2C519_9LACO|nr:ABC transporter, permease protein, DrrB family [Lacticaseibacillus thailandensis DSM 22698 = JCM 13996]
MRRIAKELLRDPRTLALVFVAPVLVMWLMSVVFSVNSTTHVDVATVGVQSSLRTQLNDVKHVSAHKYTTNRSAKAALKSGKVDAIVKEHDSRFDVTYANTDSTKTSMTKLAFQSSMTSTTLKELSAKVTKLAMANATLQAKMQAQVAAQGATSTTPTTTAGKTKQTTKAVKVHNHYVYGDSNTSYFDKIMPIMMAFFVFLFVFLVSGMALLKERSTGTLDRVLATPVRRSEIVLGYLGTYGILALLQTVVIVISTVWLLNVEVVGNLANVILVNVLVAFVAVTAGIFLSTLAASEFQMMQFLPIVLVPQIFLSGLIPLDALPKWLDYFSYIFPIRYAADAQNAIIFNGDGLSKIWVDLVVLLAFAVVLAALNVVGLKRYRKV